MFNYLKIKKLMFIEMKKTGTDTLVVGIYKKRQHPKE